MGEGVRTWANTAGGATAQERTAHARTTVQYLSEPHSVRSGGETGSGVKGHLHRPAVKGDSAVVIVASREMDTQGRPLCAEESGETRLARACMQGKDPYSV